MAHLADRVGARRLLWIALFAWSVLLSCSALRREVGLRGGPDAGRDRRGEHRHRHERRGVAPPDRPAGGAGPLPCPVQHRGAGGGGRGRAGAARRGVLALGLAGRRRRGPGGRVWSGHRVACPTTPGRAGAQQLATADAHPMRRLRRDGLLVLLFVFALAEITEGGVDTWGVLFLRNHLATGVLLGAGAYVVGQSVAATTRGAGGASRPAVGPARPDRRRVRGRGGHPARIGLARCPGGRPRPGPGGRRGVAVLAPGDEHRERAGQPGGERRGDLHRGRLHRLGGRRAGGGLGVADLRARHGGCRSSPWPRSASPSARCSAPGAAPAGPRFPGSAE